jgi:hypothetical protein
MALTTSQQATLKTYIQADPILGTLITGVDSINQIISTLNSIVIPDYFIWNKLVPTDAINDAITWTNFTPNDSPDTTVLFQNRALICQIKLEQLQALLIGRTFFDATKQSQVSGLQDALTNLPSGISGTNRSGGWPAVKLILSKQASVVQKLFATGTGTQASPATAIVNSVDYEDIRLTMAW